MSKKYMVVACLLVSVFGFVQCTKKDGPASVIDPYAAIKAKFGTRIDPDNLLNYAAQPKPSYIVKDNSVGNAITDSKATLGRVLFYDKSLSINNTVSCGSCHKQQFAFSDTSLASAGVEGGITGRHSMRLVNARFGVERKFFWNERAASLEQQTTMPVQDHAEMGFSGQNGRPALDSLLRKLSGIGYYKELFQFAYGDQAITESRMQECMAQFIRSIQSFDAKYDVGRAQVANNNVPFPNFTQQENMGKNLFTAAPVFDAAGVRTSGGAGCNGCHNAPEFDIDPNTGNNGIIGNLNAPGFDFNNTRAPSLRNLNNTAGVVNGPMMHTGVISTLQAAIGHYGTINANPANTNLDPRLRPNGFGQQLNFTAQEVNALIAFLNTLAGTDVYTNVKWSDPF